MLEKGDCDLIHGAIEFLLKDQGLSSSLDVEEYRDQLIMVIESIDNALNHTSRESFDRTQYERLTHLLEKLINYRKTYDFPSSLYEYSQMIRRPEWGQIKDAAKKCY